jgi:hypothetical protein
VTFIKIRSHRRKFSNSDSIEQKNANCDTEIEKSIQGLSELADQNNTVKSSSSGNNSKNILKNPSSLDFKIRTFLIDQSRVDIKLP